MQPPIRVKVLSDDNELEFQEILTPNRTKDKFYIYKYTKSVYKLGNLIGWTEIELTKILSNNTIKAI